LLTSLGEGARLYVVGEFASLGSNLLIVVPGKTETAGTTPFITGAPNDLTVEDAEALGRRIPQIRRVAPVALGTGPVSFRERSRDITIFGTTNELLDIRKLEIGIGRYLPPDVRDAPICVIGAKIQRELFGNENPLGETLRVGETRCRVIGVMAPRGTSIGVNLDEVVHLPVDTCLRIFNRTGLFRVLCEVASHRDMETAERQMLDVLIERHNGEEDVTILTQDAVLSTFTQILGILTAALAGIAAISLTVAGIGIMNVMLVSVSERTREIGLLKALGVTRRQIVGVFLIEAALISTSGGVLGLLSGIAGGRIIMRIIPDFPVQPPIWAALAAVLVSVSVGLLFGILPSRRAAQLDPIEALMRKRA
jgi:putative ABC transport system permease protein